MNAQTKKPLAEGGTVFQETGSTAIVFGGLVASVAVGIGTSSVALGIATLCILFVLMVMISEATTRIAETIAATKG